MSSLGSEGAGSGRDRRPGGHVSPAWAAWRSSISVDEYEARFDRLAASGAAVHGEADFVASLGPRRLVDAGCGTGRMAVELDRRGFEVVGVDLDDEMLAAARAKPSGVRWVLGDLAHLDLGERFPLVVMAGNVMLFCLDDDRASIVANLAGHLEPGGLLVAGHSLRPGGPTVDEYDGYCRAAGLDLVERFAGWSREPSTPTSDYQLSVHRLA
jgi:SAM-dependent methyltransferase